MAGVQFTAVRRVSRKRVIGVEHGMEEVRQFFELLFRKSSQG
jgi:hypothetical protein